jgi:hypothetical protein
MPPDLSDTFNGKLLLLVIDKIVIGALLAIAFFMYDRYKTNDARKYDESRAGIQLSFERSKLLKEFLPLIQDAKVDLTTRAYLLRSAVVSGAIDSETAFELGQDFLRAGLAPNHYLRVISAMLPKGIASFANRGVQIADEWHSSLHSYADLDSVFDPVSGQEHLPEKDGPMIVEARLLRTALYEKLPSLLDCECAELRDEAEIPAYLYGLFVLMKTKDRDKAAASSLAAPQALKVIGMLNRFLENDGDDDAEKFLEALVSSAPTSKDKLRLAQVVVAILKQSSTDWDVSTSKAIAPLMARLATDQIFADDKTDEEGSLFWLRFNAAEGLYMMKGFAFTAESQISEYLMRFTQAAKLTYGDKQMELLSQKYSSGKIIRVLIEVLGALPNHVEQPVLKDILALGEDRLRHFPFLAEDARRAIEGNNP